MGLLELRQNSCSQLRLPHDARRTCHEDSNIASGTQTRVHHSYCPSRHRKVPIKTPAATCAPPSAPSTKPTARNRREKSGVPALDRFVEPESRNDVRTPVPVDLSDEDDWDLIEKDVAGEAFNGPNKQGSLWSRGVVDRYKLAIVFRKSSTPTQRSRARPTFSPAGSSSRSVRPSVPVTLLLHWISINARGYSLRAFSQALTYPCSPRTRWFLKCWPSRRDGKRTVRSFRCK